MKEKWFPRVLYQQKSINNIVVSGPYMPKLENLSLSTWELWSNYTFILSLEVQHYLTQTQSIQENKELFPYPLTSSRLYKSVIQRKHRPMQPCTPGTSDEALLQAKLLKECAKTKRLIQISKQMQNPQKEKEDTLPQQLSPATRRRNQRDQGLSPLTLRRRYLPRLPRRDRGHRSSSSSTSSTSSRKSSSTSSSSS